MANIVNKANLQRKINQAQARADMCNATAAVADEHGETEAAKGSRKEALEHTREANRLIALYGEWVGR